MMPNLQETATSWRKYLIRGFVENLRAMAGAKWGNMVPIIVDPTLSYVTSVIAKQRSVAGTPTQRFKRPGDRHAIDQQYAFAYALALDEVGNSADAEDVAQSALVKVWSESGRYTIEEVACRAWLSCVVMDCCHEQHDVERGDWAVQANEPIDDVEDCVRSIHRNAVFSCLERAIDGLTHKQRIAIVSSYYDSMTNADIAKVMGTRTRAVTALLERARKRLQRSLKRSADDVAWLMQRDRRR